MAYSCTYCYTVGKIHFDVNLMPGTGNFEVMEGDSVKANGRIVSVDATEDGSHHTQIPVDLEQKDIHIDIKTPDVYKEFRLRGYDYGPSFQGIIGANLDSKIVFCSCNICIHYLEIREWKVVIETSGMMIFR